jgi:hypothetical protein
MTRDTVAGADDGPPLRFVLLGWAALLFGQAWLFGDRLLLPGHQDWLWWRYMEFEGADPFPEPVRNGIRRAMMMLNGAFGIGASVLVARSFRVANAADWRLARLLAYAVSLLLLVRMLLATSFPYRDCSISATEDVSLLVLGGFALIFAPVMVGRATVMWSAPRFRRWRRGRTGFRPSASLIRAA